MLQKIIRWVAIDLDSHSRPDVHSFCFKTWLLSCLHLISTKLGAKHIWSYLFLITKWKNGYYAHSLTEVTEMTLSSQSHKLSSVRDRESDVSLRSWFPYLYPIRVSLQLDKVILSYNILGFWVSSALSIISLKWCWGLWPQRSNKPPLQARGLPMGKEGMQTSFRGIRHAWTWGGSLVL